MVPLVQREVVGCGTVLDSRFAIVAILEEVAVVDAHASERWDSNAAPIANGADEAVGRTKC
jgi:hypothetical protein